MKLKKIGKNFSCDIKKMSGYMTDNVLNPVHIEMRSNREFVMEGCEKIEEYDENIVKVAACKMTISLFGKNLEIRCLNPDSLIVSGFICSIEFST